MNGDLPTITDASHSHSIYSAGDLARAAMPQLLTYEQATQIMNQQTPRVAKLPSPVATLKKEPAMAKPVRRLVQVFIADPDENVPLEKSLLYSGEQKLTDATDEELFFEIDIRSILARYNEERIKIVNKKVKDRTEYLEPVRVRDLKMVVTTVASF